MRNTICSVTLVIAALVAHTSAFAELKLKFDGCFVIGYDQPATVRGLIVQSATTEESEGVTPYKYMAIVLDKPICYGVPKYKITFTEVAPLTMKWLGHYVDLTGEMMTSGEGESITVRAIKDVVLTNLLRSKSRRYLGLAVVSVCGSAAAS
jgi:hypothetical protein